MDTDKCSIENFRYIMKELDGLYSLFIKACKLSYAEYWSLFLVSEGECTYQHEIGETLFMSKQTVNSALKQLVKKGLVQLKLSEENQRLKTIELTDKGKKFAEKYVKGLNKSEEYAWNELSKDEQNMLLKLETKFKIKFESSIKSELNKNI